MLATGDDPNQLDNALARFRPIFARRVDVLLVAGANHTLNVPLAAHEDPYVRESFALAPIPDSAEAEAIGPISTFQSSQAITLGPNVTVTVETAYPVGADSGGGIPGLASDDRPRPVADRGGLRRRRRGVVPAG